MCRLELSLTIYLQFKIPLQINQNILCLQYRLFPMVRSNGKDDLMNDFGWRKRRGSGFTIHQLEYPSFPPQSRVDGGPGIAEFRRIFPTSRLRRAVGRGWLLEDQPGKSPGPHRFR